MYDDEAEDDPGTADLIEMVISAREAENHGPAVGHVVSYDAAKRTVDVRPAVLRYHDGALMPDMILRAVPVAWPGGGSCALTWPLVAGDPGTLKVLDRDHDRYLGQGTKAAAPFSRRRLSLADVVFEPWAARPAAEALPADAVAVDGLVVFGGKVYLTSAAAADFIALASKTDAELQALATWGQTHSHPAHGAPPSVLPSTPGSVASAKVAAE